MKFKGKYKNNVFVPNKSNEGIYYRFIELAEQNDIEVVNEIKRSSVTSLAQVGLFNSIINMVYNETGNQHWEIIEQLDDIRIKELDEDGKIQNKILEEYDTLELTFFIERAIVFLNDYYHLNLDIIESNGKAKIINEKH